MFLTARTAEREGILAELVDALASLDLDVRADDGSLVVDGVRANLNIAVRAHPTPSDLRQLVSDTAGRYPAVLVADRISEAGRDVLRDASWGWLDRRGHLRIWMAGLRMESPLPSGTPTASSGRPREPWTTVGFEIALAALCEPTDAVTARRVAPIIGRSAGSTHALIQRFINVGLVGPKTHRPLLPELFWEASARWPDDGWVSLPVPLADVAERVGPGELVRVDERAATLGGARITAAAEMAPRAYVRTASAFRRARALSERGADTSCWVRPAPIRWLPVNDAHPATDQHPWAVGHPMVCALRLAADPSRGREIVEAWGIVPNAR